MSADKEKYEREAAEWLAHMHKDYQPVEFEKSLEKFREKLILGSLSLANFTSEEEIEKLRTEKYMQYSRDILKRMIDQPEPEGSDLDKIRKAELLQARILGRFSEDDLRKKYGGMRRSDDLHPDQTGADVRLRLKLLKELIEKIGVPAAQEQFRINNEVAVNCLQKIKLLQTQGKLDIQEFEHSMRYFRKAVLGGFTKEQLQGGTWFDLEKDFKITHQQLRDLDPRNKK